MNWKKELMGWKKSLSILAVGGGIVMLWHYFNPNGGIVSDFIGALGEVLFFAGLVFLIWSFFKKNKS